MKPTLKILFFVFTLLSLYPIIVYLLYDLCTLPILIGGRVHMAITMTSGPFLIMLGVLSYWLFKQTYVSILISVIGLVWGCLVWYELINSI